MCVWFWFWFVFFLARANNHNNRGKRAVSQASQARPSQASGLHRNEKLVANTWPDAWNFRMPNESENTAAKKPDEIQKKKKNAKQEKEKN